MPQLHLSDQIFSVAQRRAAEEGYSSVDGFVSDVLAQTLAPESDNHDDLFTPERIAELERISAEIKGGGKTYTMAEVDEHFQNKRKAWLANHAT
jgi:hypothetical protein